MNSKISSLKEKMRQALNSTMKVIAEDFQTKNKRLQQLECNYDPTEYYQRKR